LKSVQVGGNVFFTGTWGNGRGQREVNAIIQRLITGAGAAGIITLILSWSMRTEAPFALIFLAVLFSFWIPGTAAAVIAEWAADYFAGPKTSRGKAYVMNTLSFALAGYIFYWLIDVALFGLTQPEQTSIRAAAIGVPAMLVYFHVSLLVRRVIAYAINAKYGVPLETERLELIPCTIERFEQAIEEGYLVGDHVTSYISALRRHPGLLGWGVWLVRLKETGQIIGDIGFKGTPDFTGVVDIGYGFLPQHWGKGYATEATKALVAWAFAHGAGRVTAETLRDNHASIRVLRKSGFQLYREAEHYYWRKDAERVYK